MLVRERFLLIYFCIWEVLVIISRFIEFVKKPKRSIRSRIISIFMIIIVILNIVFFLSFIRRDREIEIYQNNVDVNCFLQVKIPGFCKVFFAATQ